MKNICYLKDSITPFYIRKWRQETINKEVITYIDIYKTIPVSKYDLVLIEKYNAHFSTRWFVDVNRYEFCIYIEEKYVQYEPYGTEAGKLLYET